MAAPKIILRANTMFLLPLGSMLMGVILIRSTLSTITLCDTATIVLME